MAIGEKEQKLSVADDTIFLDFDGKPTDLTVTSPLLKQLIKYNKELRVKITSEPREGKEILLTVRLPLRIAKDNLTPKQRRRLKYQAYRESLIGKPLPPFKITNLRNGTYENKSFSGKIVVIDFWATWCGPCLKVSPIMQDLHDKYAEKGLVVIGASIETDRSEDGQPTQKAISNYKTSNHSNYLFAFNANQFADACKIPGIPTVLVADREGMIRQVEIGYWEDEDLRSTLEETIRRLLD